MWLDLQIGDPRGKGWGCGFGNHQCADSIYRHDLIEDREQKSSRDLWRSGKGRQHRKTRARGATSGVGDPRLRGRDLQL